MPHEAIERAADRRVSRETYGRLEQFADLLRRENERQNLVAAGTIDSLWDRHILDSAQLLRFAPRDDASWVDIGSGAGLPGLVIAILSESPVTLVEPRRLRAQFLADAASELGLSGRVAVVQAKAERTAGSFDIISGRAVARLSSFLHLSLHLSTRNTIWVLPKGKRWQSELDEARQAWQALFHVEPSITDQEARIVIASRVLRRGGK